MGQGVERLDIMGQKTETSPMVNRHVSVKSPTIEGGNLSTKITREKEETPGEQPGDEGSMTKIGLRMVGGTKGECGHRLGE